MTFGLQAPRKPDFVFAAAIIAGMTVRVPAMAEGNAEQAVRSDATTRVLCNGRSLTFPDAHHSEVTGQ